MKNLLVDKYSANNWELFSRENPEMGESVMTKLTVTFCICGSAFLLYLFSLLVLDCLVCSTKKLVAGSSINLWYFNLILLNAYKHISEISSHIS